MLHAAPHAALQTTTDRLSESRAALERKAALYERLARGEVDDDGEGQACGSSGRRCLSGPTQRGAPTAIHWSGHPLDWHTAPQLCALLAHHLWPPVPHRTAHPCTADDKYEVDFLMKGRQPELDTSGMAVHSGTGARPTA